MNESTLRFESADGAVVAELDPRALAALAAGESGQSPWKLANPPDWERFDSLRLLAAAFGDGTVAALTALRPIGATGHDTDQIAAVLVDRGETVESAHEALLSTEVDADGRIRRVGLEFWGSPEPPPRRLAADRAHTNDEREDGVSRESVLMEARLDGRGGTALFEVIRPAPAG